MMDRAEFIAGLREAADFLEAHPELPSPYSELVIDQFVASKDELRALVKATGGRWEKGANGDYFWLTRRIGSLRYDVNIQRAQVCRRVVTGVEEIPAHTKERVEWVCEDSLMEAL